MKNKKENKARIIALWVIGGMVVIWVVLGIFSFTENRGTSYHRPQSSEVTFEGQTGLRGKQVFQAYNGMDCHTIVGNGGYFAPDLTKIYKEVGPAWLKAYLGSPGSYPTKALVQIQLQQQIKDGQVQVADLDDYYSKFKEAKRRIERRGGQDALMPNLRFSQEEINALIAFFKYTSMLNTAGWPPEVIARESIIEAERQRLEEKSGISVHRTAELPPPGGNNNQGAISAAASGKTVATNLGCMACHSTDGSVKTGPSWKGLYNSTVTLADGKTILADTTYIKRSIFHPNAEIVNGFQKGLMPSYEGVVSEEQLTDLMAYIESLK